MLSQTAHQRVLFGVCGPPGCTSRVSGLAAACHSFHLASPSPPQPCSWPGRTHSLPLHALAMSVVKPELGLQPDSFPAGLLWCSPGATRYLRTRPVRQVVMARPTARLHRTRPGGCPPGVLLLSPSDRFCRASRLRRVPVSGWPAAVTFLCAYVPGFCLRCLGRLGHAPLSRVGWTLDSEPARRPTLSLSVARSPAWSP